MDIVLLITTKTGYSQKSYHQISDHPGAFYIYSIHKNTRVNNTNLISNTVL